MRPPAVGPPVGEEAGSEIPKRLNWNAFRYVISPVPQMWLDIADEEGMLIQYEPTLWGYHPQWDFGEMVNAIWPLDEIIGTILACSCGTPTTDRLAGVRRVRQRRAVSRSVRTADGTTSWSPPAGPHNPVEVHPYLLNG